MRGVRAKVDTYAPATRRGLRIEAGVGFDEDLKFTATHWLKRIEADADADAAGDGATDPVGEALK